MDQLKATGSPVVVLVGGGGRIGEVLLRSFEESEADCMAVGRSIEEKPESQSIRILRQDATADGFPSVLLNALTTDWPGRKVRIIWNARGRENAADFSDDAARARKALFEEAELGLLALERVVRRFSLGPEPVLESVVLISSIYGMVGPTTGLYEDVSAMAGTQYGMVKAAQIHLTRELAIRYANAGVRVNCVSYGGVGGRASEEFVERYSRFCPTGRMLEDQDLPGPVHFLLSDAASGITGQNLVVDGGWTSH